MIIVTGATGNIGRPLVNLLADAGHAVTALARGTAPLPSRDDVKPLVADLSDLDTVTPALAGADAVFLLVTGDLVAGDLDIRTLLHAADAAGVHRLVLLSSQLAGTRPRSASHSGSAKIENAVRSSDLDWTILQPAGFMSNDLRWADTVRAQRKVFSPYADTPLPVIAPFDIASVAAEVLTADGHSGRSYVLTGPEALSPRQRVRHLGEALGEELVLAELSHDDAKAQLMQQMPEPIAEGTLRVLGHPTAEEQTTSHAVPEILGRPATSYAAWAEYVADAFH